MYINLDMMQLEDTALHFIPDIHITKYKEAIIIAIVVAIQVAIVIAGFLGSIVTEYLQAAMITINLQKEVSSATKAMAAIELHSSYLLEF